MTLEILAPTALVVFGAVFLTYTQLIAPKRARQRISRSLIRQGWMRVPPDRDNTWTSIMTLAIEDQQGTSQGREYDRRIGPFTAHVKRTGTCSGRALELYRDMSTNQPRYAALGVRKETIVYSERGRFLLLNRKEKKYYTSRELWIGEVRQMPVDKPEKVYNAIDDVFGRSLKKMASDQGVNPDAIPLLASPSEVTTARAVRELLKKTNLAQSIMSSVYFGPEAWVLVVPIQKVGSHIEDILGLVAETSAIIHVGYKA